MANERPDYRVLVSIPDPINAGRSAYLPGEGISAQVVKDWELAIGEQVESLRPEQIAVPARNARRDEWVTYALSQGREADELEPMGRNEIRDLFEEQAAKGEAA